MYLRSVAWHAAAEMVAQRHVEESRWEAGSRSVGFGPGDGRSGLPAFVPSRWAPAISRAAQLFPDPLEDVDPLALRDARHGLR